MDLEKLKELAERHSLVGVYDSVKNEHYHAGPGYSKSGCDYVDQSPLHFLKRSNEPSKAMTEGTWFHTFMLEPNRVTEEWVISQAGVNWGTQKYEAIQAENPGKSCVPEDVYERFKLMKRSALDLPIVQAALEYGFKELSAWAVDPDTGLLVKARPDVFLPAQRFLVDFKTTTDASPKAFSRSCINFGYDKQAGMHLDVFNHAQRQHAKKTLGTDPGDSVDSFIIVAVESGGVHGAAAYALPHEILEIGRHKYQQNLRKLAECHQTGQWDCYPKEIQTLEFPNWAYYG